MDLLEILEWPVRCLSALTDIYTQGLIEKATLVRTSATVQALKLRRARGSQGTSHCHFCVFDKCFGLRTIAWDMDRKTQQQAREENSALTVFYFGQVWLVFLPIYKSW